MATKKKSPARKAPARKKAAPAKKAVPAKKRAAPKKSKWVAAKPEAPEPQPERNPWGESQKRLEAFGIATVCARIIDGKMLAEVAKEATVSSGALLAWLDASPERSARAREARKLGAAVLEERAHQAIADARDNFQLAKARELAHHLRWKASKLDPRGFGDKLALGAAPDLPPLPAPAPSETNVTVTLEVAPAEAYQAMLQRARA